jgi:hypothetical protein
MKFRLTEFGRNVETVNRSGPVHDRTGQNDIAGRLAPARFGSRGWVEIYPSVFDLQDGKEGLLGHLHGTDLLHSLFASLLLLKKLAFT